jgi:hypothetical protein
MANKKALAELPLQMIQWVQAHLEHVGKISFSVLDFSRSWVMVMVTERGKLTDLIALEAQQHPAIRRVLFDLVLPRVGQNTKVRVESMYVSDI